MSSEKAVFQQHVESVNRHKQYSLFGITEVVHFYKVAFISGRSGS